MHGQLGLESVDNKLLPTHASLLDSWQVSFIAAGYGHSAVLTAEVMSSVTNMVVETVNVHFVLCDFLFHKPLLQNCSKLNHTYIILLIFMPTGKSFNIWKWYVDTKLFKNSTGKYSHDNTYNVMEGHCYSMVTF